MRYIQAYPAHVTAQGNAPRVLGLVGLPDRARAKGGRNRGGATAP